jgi:23S rRNA pseudouridine1911/1915/1917 synthase
LSEILKPRILRLEIEEADAGKTIKEYLMRRIGFSSKQLSRFKYRRDGILLNGEKRYVNAALQAGDVLEIRLTQGGEAAEKPDGEKSGAPGGDDRNGNAGGYLAARDGRLQKIWVKPADWLSERFPLKILYEDGDILAVDKPSGVVCHPSPGHFDDTLSNQVAEHLGRIGQELDVRVTGRLDKDTSGIVVFALNTETAAQLIKQRQAQLKEAFSFGFSDEGAAEGVSADPEKVLQKMTSGENYKLYIARVRGHFGDRLSGTVDRPLRRESPDSFYMIGADDGKAARTHYYVLAQLSDGTSLVACRIEHGRTHQIRVHMALTGHPILGDRMYGPEKEEAGAGAVPLMLHACRAGFRQPFTGQKIRIEAPLPDWAGAVKKIVSPDPDGAAPGFCGTKE